MEEKLNVEDDGGEEIVPAPLREGCHSFPKPSGKKQPRGEAATHFAYLTPDFLLLFVWQLISLITKCWYSIPSLR